MSRVYFTLILLLICFLFFIGCGQRYPNEFGIFTETYTNSMVKLNVKNPPDKLGGYQGKWHSSNDLNNIGCEVVSEPGQEGKQCLKVTVKEGQWGGGIWFQMGYTEDKDPVKKAADLSEFKNGFLVFSLKTPKPVLIKLESEADDKSAKATQVTSDQFNAPADNKWHVVQIPLSAFKDVDMSRVNVLFGAHYVVPADSVTYWVDNIYYKKK